MTVPVRAEHRLLLLGMFPEPEALARQELRSLVCRPIDWSYILAASRRLGTLPLLACAMSRAGAEPPPDVQAQCQRARVLSAARALVAERTLHEIQQAFEAARIPFLVLKGLPLAHELYPDPGLRPVGDIDVLVPRRFRDAGLAAMRELGYNVTDDSLPLNFFRRHHFHACLVRSGQEGLPVEFHWDVQPPFSLSRIPEEEVWKSVRRLKTGSEEIQVPARETNYLLLLQHLSRHTLGLRGAGDPDPIAFLLNPSIQGRLVWVTDLVLLGRGQPALDWTKVSTDALTWGLVGDLLALDAMLHRLGLPPVPVTDAVVSFSGRPHARFRRAWAVTKHFPLLARTSTLLQLRPVLILEALCFAFPDLAWIRKEYDLGESGKARLASRWLQHALGTLFQLCWMGASALSGAVWKRGGIRRSASRSAPGRTHLVKTFTPLGNCHETISKAKV